MTATIVPQSSETTNWRHAIDWRDAKTIYEVKRMVRVNLGCFQMRKELISIWGQIRKTFWSKFKLEFQLKNLE